MESRFKQDWFLPFGAKSTAMGSDLSWALSQSGLTHFYTLDCHNITE